jgi:micrococcal nuclease
MYEYRARLVRLRDADTCILDLDLGFHSWRLDQPYRLLRINAPELSTPEGKAAKAALEDYLTTKVVLVARTQKTDNFGRFLAELTADGENVSDWLVANGHAKYQVYS